MLKPQQEYKINSQLSTIVDSLTTQIDVEQGYYNSMEKLIKEQMLPTLIAKGNVQLAERYIETVEIMRKTMLSIVELIQKREYIIHLINIKDVDK